MNWAKGNKYRAKRTNGFPSQLEAAVHALLKWREKAREISEIRQQHAVFLTDAKIRCKIDFSFVDNKTRETVFCEAKGFVTERWRIIKDLWPHYGPGKLEIWVGDYRKPRLEQIIDPDKAPADLGDY